MAFSPDAVEANRWREEEADARTTTICCRIHVRPFLVLLPKRVGPDATRGGEGWRRRQSQRRVDQEAEQEEEG